MRDKPDGKRPVQIFTPKPQAEVDDELKFHLEQRVRDYVARGMDPAAARAKALERFGDVNGVRRECTQLLEEDRRVERRRDWLADLGQDLRFAARSAARAPLFSLLAVATLALGIGANAAVFSVVNAVLLRSLPYADEGRLVRVYGRFLHGGDERGPLSAGTVADVARRQRSFTRVAAFAMLTRDGVYNGDAGPRSVKIEWAEPELFRTLGVSPALGRAFRDEDAQTDTAFNVLMTHAAWQRLFAGDPGVLSRPVRINGISRTVVGVLPRTFVGPAGDADFYFPLGIAPLLRNPIGARGSHWLSVVGRLKPGVTVEAARRDLVAIAADLAKEYPRDNGSVSVTVLPLREAMVGDTRTPLLVLMASAGLVLLITCANLAGALLSRTLSRRKEFAVRVALGAGRGRLVRQLLTESTLLAVVGGAAGVLLATLGLAVLRGLALHALPSYAELSLDPGALLFTSVLALATGVAFGLAPALSVGRSDPQGTLRDETRGTSESRRSRQLRGVLVAGQIALCLSLLVGAGLLARSLWALAATPLGFNPQGVLTAAVRLPNGRYPTPEASLRFYQQFGERLRALPGVSGVGFASELPVPVMNRMGIVVEGVTWPAESQPFVTWQSVSDDYFRTMGIPLKHGRTFGPTEGLESPPKVVISESMARRFWPKGNAVGSRVRFGPNPNAPWNEVVGIVGDVRNGPAAPEAEPLIYSSMRQTGFAQVVVLRTRGDPLALVRPVERELAALDPGIPLDNPTTVGALVSAGLAGRRLPVVLMSAFGALALALASVGVYAMFASMAAAREREFGVRVALGSSRGAIARLVLRQGAAWMALGLAAGAFGVVVITRVVRGLLYGVAPFDPAVIGVAVLTLLACGAVALLGPVRRATRADPISVLR